MNDYPIVRTDDILIHPRDGDVIVATHGRSIFIADDITPLEQLTPSVQAQDAYLFAPRPAVAYVNDITNNPHIGGQKNFIGQNAPRGTALNYYLKSAATDEGLGDRRPGHTLCTSDGIKAPGIHRVEWGLVAPMLGGGGGGGGGWWWWRRRWWWWWWPGWSWEAGCAGGGGGRGGGGGGGGGNNAVLLGFVVKLTVNGQSFSSPSKCSRIGGFERADRSSARSSTGAGPILGWRQSHAVMCSCSEVRRRIGAKNGTE